MNSVHSHLEMINYVGKSVWGCHQTRELCTTHVALEREYAGKLKDPSIFWKERQDDLSIIRHWNLETNQATWRVGTWVWCLVRGELRIVLEKQRIFNIDNIIQHLNLNVVYEWVWGKEESESTRNSFHFIRFGCRNCSSSKSCLQSSCRPWSESRITLTFSRLGHCHSLIPHPSNYVSLWRVNRRFGNHLLFLDL